MSVATPTSSVSPGIVTRTRRPRVSHRERYSSAIGAVSHPDSRHSSSAEPMARRKARTTVPRSITAAPASCRDVAVGTGSSASVRLTLMPTPDTAVTTGWVEATSTRMPATLPPA